MYLSCHYQLPEILPQFYGISDQFYDYDRREWLYNPEYFALVEKECGSVPEGADEYSYHYDRYGEFESGSDWEAVLYFSDEVFDPDNYNEKSIIRESKIAF